MTLTDTLFKSERGGITETETNEWSTLKIYIQAMKPWQRNTNSQPSPLNSDPLFYSQLLFTSTVASKIMQQQEEGAVNGIWHYF